MNIIFVPQIHAERTTPTRNMACISICEPPHVADLHGDWRFLLRLQFDDVDKALYPDIVLFNNEVPAFFTEDQADQIIEFVDGLPKDIDLLMVHCHAGISRSAGVSLALHEYLEIPIEHPHKYQLHNRFVAGIIRKRFLKKWLGEDSDSIFLRT